MVCQERLANSWGPRQMGSADSASSVADRQGVYGAFTLIEMLVVLAIIAMLLAILLPGLAGAREQARAAVCGAHLHQIGLAAACYAQESQGWLVGSPNTSGNGARPGFGFDDGSYTDTYNRENYPALHVFDWANPLLRNMGTRPPRAFMARYKSAVEQLPRCPSDRRRAGPVEYADLMELIPPDALAPSYATSRYFMYVGTAAATENGVCGELWWWEDCVPAGYVPKIGRLRHPAVKAFLADAHVVSKTKGQIANANWGFTSQGAWRAHDVGPVTYRGSFLREEMWRHRNAINILAFDGHVERQKNVDDGDGKERANGGLGSHARYSRWWFPTGTEIGENLPSWRSASKEPILVVP